MTWLPEETEQRSREPLGFAQQGVLLVARRRWWLWVSAKILLLLFGLYWLPRQRSAGSDGDSQQGSDSGVEEETEEENCQVQPDPDPDQIQITPDPDQPLGEVGASTARATRFPKTTF